MSNLKEEYFEWLLGIVCRGRFRKNISYRKLLSYLHSIEYRWSLPDDVNRAEDGEEGMRWSFIYENHITTGYELNDPCSVLEMVMGLAYRCEDIMDDAAKGNRTVQWFWQMINNLGLGGMTDDRFDEKEVSFIIERFLNREYEPDGTGGLFVSPGIHTDLRDVDTWTQMLWYLDRIT